MSRAGNTRTILSRNGSSLHRPFEPLADSFNTLKQASITEILDF